MLYLHKGNVCWINIIGGVASCHVVVLSSLPQCSCVETEGEVASCHVVVCVTLSSLPQCSCVENEGGVASCHVVVLNSLPQCSCVENEGGVASCHVVVLSSLPQCSCVEILNNICFLSPMSCRISRDMSCDHRHEIITLLPKDLRGWLEVECL